MTVDVLCVGSATLDNFLIIGQSIKEIKPGDKVLVQALEKHTGGGATNSAVALTKLGLNVNILTKVGEDHDGEFILKELNNYQIKNICLKRSKKNTDVSTLISSIHEKDRIIYVHKGASADLRTNDFKLGEIKAPWIYLASLTGRSYKIAKKIAAYAKKNKIKLLFNPSLYLARRGQEYLQTILRATTILVLNKEEAQAILGQRINSEKELLEKLRKLGPQIVIITNGSKKLSASDGELIYNLTPFKVMVKQTAGAGDAFTSGFLSGIIKNYPLEKALCLGQVNAASVVQYLGTKKGLLTERDAEKMRKKHHLRVEAHYVR